MLYKTILAGFGGQGVLLVGVCLATAGMNEDKNVTFLPSYGAEVRGGTANCTVSISTEEIASPIASSPDCVVAFNSPSMKKFQNLIRPGGIFVINSTLAEEELARKDVIEYRVPATELAEKLGAMRSTNMVMLGAFNAATKVVSHQGLTDAVNSVAGSKKKELAELNLKAFQAGYEYVKDLKKKSSEAAKAAGEKNPETA
jgi:2-oxoglutarate ferredoxin oxidoreductase subunit gamma